MDSISIIVSIRKIVRSLNLESKSLQKEFGLSITQILTLNHLEKSPNYQSSHGDLMQLLSLNSSTVTGILNRLEKRGYLARLPHPTDKRVTNITLTASGLKLLEQMPNILHDRLSKKLDTLDDPDKNMIQKALMIIIDAMQIDKITASPLLTPDEPID